MTENLFFVFLRLWDFMRDREEREWEPPAVDHYWTESEDEED